VETRCLGMRCGYLHTCCSRMPDRGHAMINLIVWLLLGALVGWLASMVMRTDAQQGVFLNIVVGIVGAMQQFLGEGAWDDAAILERHWQEVDADLGDDDGVLILDGSDFPKQGQESVGVKRQYCGELGKTANCQAGVFLAYASQQGYTLLDRRLYLPEEWLADQAYAIRRKACGIPETSTFTTKPLLGWSMIEAIQQAGTLRCRWVACDEGFGRDTTLLDQIDSLGLWYFAEARRDR
jgi:SRSO17 transposase